MRRRAGDHIAAVVLCVWGAWSLACYQSNDDRCMPGQVRCEDSGSYAWTAKTCVENTQGPHYFEQASCPKRTSTCKIGQDTFGTPRAYCTLGDEPDERCAPGVFEAQCTEDGWIQCADGHLSYSSWCPYSAACVIDADGVGGCGAATEPSPACEGPDVRFACDGDSIAVRCDSGYELARYPCGEGTACDPSVGKCELE